MTTKTTNDGLYCLWTEEGVYAARIRNGQITSHDDTTATETAVAIGWGYTHLAKCETMDDMPTVERQLADAICEACGLHAELVAVCKID